MPMCKLSPKFKSESEINCFEDDSLAVVIVKNAKWEVKSIHVFLGEDELTFLTRLVSALNSGDELTIHLMTNFQSL